MRNHSPRYFLLLAVLLSMCASLLRAQPVDYSNVKPSHYDKLENGSTFSDKHGDSFRVQKTKYEKGLYIETVQNGIKKWKKHGVFYHYYEGRLTEQVDYHYGQKHGQRERYTRKGIVQFREQYSKGALHGHWEQFNDKGAKVAECTYKNGSKHGTCYSYYNGKLNFETMYVDGKRHGDHLQYNSKGELVARTIYNKGKRAGKTQWY